MRLGAEPIGTRAGTGRRSKGRRWAVAALTMVIAVTAPASAADTLCSDMREWPFGAGERMVPTAPAVSRPVAFLHRLAEEGFPYPPGWRARILAEPPRPPIYRLLAANGLINKVRFIKESGDVWKTPRRFLAEGGDCEDFAIAKYALVRDMGYASSDVRMTIVRRRGERNLHAVVVVRTGPSPFEVFVLDSGGGSVRTALYCEEFTPLISLNEHAVWVHAADGEALVASLGSVCISGQ